MPAKTEIESAHAAGDAQTLSRWAGEVMGLIDAHQWSDRCKKDERYCIICGARFCDKWFRCTRFATDPTSVVEFEKACMPEGYVRNINLDNSVVVYGPHGARRSFHGQPLVINWCAAIEWATADNEERNGKT